MQPLTSQRIAANAYRTLGISASAGHAAIESAARRMRIWPDPSRIPPTPWDLAWLGPLARSRPDIEQAVARCGEPASRLEDRLTWYHGQRPPAASGAAASPLPSIADRHDAAVAALHGAMTASPGPDVAGWKHAVTEFVAFSASPEYVQWLVALEEAARFDKPASRQEIEDAVDALPGAVAGALAPHVLLALDRKDAPAAGELLGLLRNCGSSPRVARAIRDVVHGLEDAIDSNCRQMDAALRDKLRTNHQNPRPWFAANYEAACDAATFYDAKIALDLQRIRMLAADETEVLARSGSRCADVLKLLALGWEWAGRYLRAEQTLVDALDLAQGLSQKAAIEKDLRRILPHADEERYETDRRRVYQEVGIRPPTGAEQPGAPVLQPPPLPRRRSARQPARGGWRVGSVLVFVLIVVSRAVVSFLGVDSSSTPPSYRPPPSNLTQPLGNSRQFQPVVMPPDAATFPRDQLHSVGEVNREP